MLTVNRFDATAGSSSEQGSQNVAASSSRLTALAEKKRKREAADDGASRPSASMASPVQSARTVSSSSTVPSTTTRPTGPSIHPSRLASAPILAQSVKRAAIKAGEKKEKTKAKQRYLNKKKTKRKALKKAKGGNKSQASTNVPTSQLPNLGHTSESAWKDTARAAAPQDEAIFSGKVTTPVIEAHVSDTDSSSSSDSNDSSSSDSDSSLESEDDVEDKAVSETSDTIKESSASSASQTQEAGQTDDVQPGMGLLLRSKPSSKLSAEAVRSLAVQGLPRGMVDAKVVDPATRQSISTTQDVSQQPEGSDIAGIRLDPALAKRLNDVGVVEWFAVQAAVIPHLLSTSAFVSPFSPPRDLCVSAPTGSGKTLAYSIPIVTILKDRIITRLRALIILPTRDLVFQVRETLEMLSKGTGLKIGTTIGAQSFAQEQTLLIDEVSQESRLDILITTPGRLVDHLDETQGFTLQHLRFLVVDEADRLLGQSFQDWARRLRNSIEGNDAPQSWSRTTALSTHHLQKSSPPMYDAACDASSAQPVVQKLLFSATLTRDPGKLSELGLRDPVFIDVRDEGPDPQGMGTTAATFTLPATLREYMLVVPTSLKPLYLIHLLLDPPKSETSAGMRRTLIFTKSVESSLRLVQLLNLFLEAHPVSTSLGRTLRVADYSSDLSPSRRRDLLASFRSDQLDVLVASDLISRGIDLPLVENVISYDVPIDVSKYVHRVGRTARANREGKSWSLVEEQEARFFKGMMKSGIKRSQGRKLEKIQIKDEELGKLKETYEVALEKLVAK